MKKHYGGGKAHGRRGSGRGGGGHDFAPPSVFMPREDEEEECEEEATELDDVPESMTVPVWMWEFGHNDPKRDSGSKMRRLGYAGLLRVGQSFRGVVLSSEATTFVSRADRLLIEEQGVSCINCSWNRLEDIPFDKMGKGKNQRILPLLVAANTVNYGKPFKMNTAEATAAALYIAGYKKDAKTLLSPFSYGPEFLKLNHDALEAYSACETHEQVALQNREYLAQQEQRVVDKAQKRRVQTPTRWPSTAYLGRCSSCFCLRASRPPRRSRLCSCLRKALAAGRTTASRSFRQPTQASCRHLTPATSRPGPLVAARSR